VKKGIDPIQSSSLVGAPFTHCLLVLLHVAGGRYPAFYHAISSALISFPSLLLLSPLLRAFVLPVPVRCAAVLDTGVVLLGFTFGDESKSEFPNFF
jgi:hypothetical protein